MRLYAKDFIRYGCLIKACFLFVCFGGKVAVNFDLIFAKFQPKSRDYEPMEWTLSQLSTVSYWSQQPEP